MGRILQPGVSSFFKTSTHVLAREVQRKLWLHMQNYWFHITDDQLTMTEYVARTQGSTTITRTRRTQKQQLNMVVVIQDYILFIKIFQKKPQRKQKEELMMTSKIWHGVLQSYVEEHQSLTLSV